MNLIKPIENFLNHRSKREKFLLFLTLILGVYFEFFHQYFLDSFENIQSLKNQIQQNQNYLKNTHSSNLSLQELKNRNQRLKNLKDVLNVQSQPLDQILMQINSYIHTHNITIWNLDSNQREKYYSFLLNGNASMQDALLLADFIDKLPLIHLESFDFDHKNFSIKAKSHKILSNPSQEYPNLTASQIIQNLKSSLKKTNLTFSDSKSQQMQFSQSKQDFKLQAILNNKAKINDRWICIGDQIKGYTLTSIQATSILLQSRDHQVVLTLKQKRKLL